MAVLHGDRGVYSMDAGGCGLDSMDARGPGVHLSGGVHCSRIHVSRAHVWSGGEAELFGGIGEFVLMSLLEVL